MRFCCRHTSIGADFREERLDVIADHQEGAELIEEWGSQADRRLAQAYGRLEAALDGMTDQGRQAARKWINSFTPEMAKAVVKMLG